MFSFRICFIGDPDGLLSMLHQTPSKTHTQQRPTTCTTLKNTSKTTEHNTNLFKYYQKPPNTCRMSLYS